MTVRIPESLEDLDRFRAALCRAPVIVFAQDRDLRYTWVFNPVFATAEDVLGKTDADLLPPSDAATLTEIKAGVLRTGVGVRREVRLETPVGVRHYDLTVEPTRDPDGSVTGVACTALDVTERAEAEAARRESEERLRLAQAAAGLGIHDFNVATGHIRWDDRVRELWGLGPDEPVTYDLFLAGLHPDDRGPTQAAVDRALDPAGDGRYHAEYRVTSRRDGVERWVVATGSVTFAGGRAVRLVGTVHDVTAQKRAESALRAGEERFRLAADAVNGIIYEYDPRTGRVERTRGLVEVLGYRPEEVPPTAAWWWEQMHPDDRPAAAATLSAGAAPDRSTTAYRVRHRDGRWLHVEDRAVVLRDAAGEPVRMVGCTVDVTDRVQAEMSLRDQLVLTRTITDNATTAIFMMDDRSCCTFMNPAAERMTGFSFAEVEGRVLHDLIHHHHPDGRPYPMPDCPIDRALPEQFDVVGHEDVFVRRSGEFFPVLVNAKPIRKNGTAVGTVIEVRDVTAEKRAAEANAGLVEQLRQADKRKDEFLATLAHELRNPLAPVRNAVEVMKRRPDAAPDVRWAGDLIDRQVRVMARLLDDLLDVSRITRGKLDLRRERVDLAAVVAAAVETSRPLIDAGGHELTVALPADPIALHADPVRLAQVFANLLNNAAKYTEPGGHIRLSAERAGGEVVVAVTDDGIGLSADMLPRLFHIFSQAESALGRAQGGLGIGLSLVRGLVELHGGTIEARSDGPRRGSTFVVRLPAAPGRAAPEPAPPAAAAGPRWRVLVADDLRDAADSLALVLQLMGHEVRTAYDGEQAVAAAAAFRPDVALLDLGMPKVNGYDACRRIREQPWGRHMRLVAVTGWGQD
jgi:PAS domain S-box-containing protein